MKSGFLLPIVRRSWSAYHAVNFTARSNGWNIPVRNGVGLDLLADLSWIEPWIQAMRGNRPGAFVDVGASTGKILLSHARLHRDQPYVAIEPQIKAACYLQQLIGANGLDAYHVYPVGLSDQPGVVTIYGESETDVTATIVPSVRPGPHALKRQIVVTTGDILLQDNEDIAAIKIDVEGAEPQVLAGLRETIERTRPSIFLEVLPVPRRDEPATWGKRLQHLASVEREVVITEREQHVAAIIRFAESTRYDFFRLVDAQVVPSHPRDSMSPDTQDYLLLPAEK